MIQTPIIDATLQNHHGYGHEYITDKNVRITLTIFVNYPRHFYQLPSPFLQITLATPTTTLWISIVAISNYPRHLIYVLSAITELHVHVFSRLCIHISGSIIADHMSGYG